MTKIQWNLKQMPRILNWFKISLKVCRKKKIVAKSKINQKENKKMPKTKHLQVK